MKSALAVLSEVAIDIVAAADEARFRDLLEAHHYLGAVPGHGLPRGQLDRGRTHPRLRLRRGRLQRARQAQAGVPSSPAAGRAGPARGRRS